jgi:tight adherence protein B
MREVWLIPALVFAAVLLAVEALSWYLTQSRRTNAAINRRLAESKGEQGRAEELNALRARDRLLDSDFRLVRHFNEFLAQTGLDINRRKFFVILAALSAVLFLAWGMAIGRGFAALALAVITALGFVVAYLRVARQRRLARFAELLPDTIDVIVRAIRVGYPLPAALELVAREMPEPVAGEFGKTADEIMFGRDLRTAVDNLFRRVGQEDLLFLILAIKVQSQTGGSLADILARLSRLLRNRTKLALKIRALSADGRISALVLSAMPFLLFAGIDLISPSYFGDIRENPIIGPALIYGALSLAIGNFIMYRMVNFRF